jgi:hypothetical protein
MLHFLSYLVKVLPDVKNPRAWIYTQYAIANIATGFLVSSNPTNLVLAGAFDIRFISFTANMVMPSLATALLLFSFLLYIVFGDEKLIPFSTQPADIAEEIRNKKPVNFNIRYIDLGRRISEKVESSGSITIESVLNPFLDRRNAVVGAFVMVATIIILLALNALYLSKGGNTGYWVTLPAAFLVFWLDVCWSWLNRREVRHISHEGKEHATPRNAKQADSPRPRMEVTNNSGTDGHEKEAVALGARTPKVHIEAGSGGPTPLRMAPTGIMDDAAGRSTLVTIADMVFADDEYITPASPPNTPSPILQPLPDTMVQGTKEEQPQPTPAVQRVLTNLGLPNAEYVPRRKHDHTTLLSMLHDGHWWL